MHVKDSTVRVTWQLPQCSGNIREIKVQYRKRGQSKWQWELKAATIADTEIIITGLEKGVEYEVRVVVVDTNGETHEMAEKTAAIDGNFPLKAFVFSSSRITFSEPFDISAFSSQSNYQSNFISFNTIV